MPRIASITNKNKNRSTSATTTSADNTRVRTSVTDTGVPTPYSAPKASNLSQYYSGKGSRLGGSVSERFSDPDFASAAQRAGISQSQYAINPGNAAYNQSILAQLQSGAPAAPVQAPGAVVTQPTVGEALQGAAQSPQYRDFSFQTPDNPYAALGSMFQQQALGNVDEKSIRRDILRGFNDRISATNQIYDQLLSQAQQTGRGEVGSGTALLAARGLAGSARGQAIATGITDQNLAREQGIQAQRANALAEIANLAESQAQEQIAAKQTARQQGYANYVDYLSREAAANETNRKNIIEALIARGISPDEIDPTQLSKIASNVRTTADVLRGEYASAKAAQEAEAAKAALEGRFELSEGQALYDADGNIIAERKKTYAPKDGGGGGGGISAIAGTAGGSLDTSSLQDAIAFLSPGMAKNEREAFNNSVNRFLKAGNTKAVEELIFKTAVNQLPDAGTKSNVTKKRAIYNQVGDLAQSLEEFYAAGGSTDILSGKKQQITNKLGKVADPELRRIGQRVTFLVDELGKAQSGAALNANEEALYKSLFPSAGKTAALNTADVGALQEALRASVEETVGVALGSGGTAQVSGSVFGDQPKAPTGSSGAVKFKLGADGKYHPV